MQRAGGRSRRPRQFTMEPAANPAALGNATARLAVGYLAAHLAAT